MQPGNNQFDRALNSSDRDRHTAASNLEGQSESSGAGDSSRGKSEDWRGNIPPKFYRVGEVVEYAGVSRQTIHNYTTMGLLHEADWTRGGHRLFDESVFHRLDKIAKLKAERRPMEYIREYFENNEIPAVAHK